VTRKRYDPRRFAVLNRSGVSMRTSHLFAQAVLALAACGCKTTYTHEVLDDAPGVEAAKRAFFAAWTKTPGAEFNLDKLSQAVEQSEDFLSFDGVSKDNSLIAGWKAYAANWGPDMNGFVSASLTETRPLATWIGDDTAITASIARILVEMPGGEQVDMQSHLTLGYRRHEGTWRVVHEHLSLDAKK
jgi:ketosteroid isomerase-like protein